jgi:hypothetical protein
MCNFISLPIIMFCLKMERILRTRVTELFLQIQITLLKNSFRGNFFENLRTNRLNRV